MLSPACCGGRNRSAPGLRRPARSLNTLETEPDDRCADCAYEVISSPSAESAIYRRMHGAAVAEMLTVGDGSCRGCMAANGPGSPRRRSWSMLGRHSADAAAGP